MNIPIFGDMPQDNILYISKFIFLGLIYVFIFHVLAVIRSDTRGTRKASKQGAKTGLEIIAGEDVIEGNRGQFLPMSQELTFGRAESNDIQIYDSTVSTHHSKISQQGNDYIIEDCGSKNGTIVNDATIEGPTVLKKGDVIRIGMLMLKFSGEK